MAYLKVFFELGNLRKRVGSRRNLLRTLKDFSRIFLKTLSCRARRALSSGVLGWVSEALVIFRQVDL